MVQCIISPSVLASDLSKLSEECKRMLDAGCDWLHMASGMPHAVFKNIPVPLSPADGIDVMDGHFVPNLTMGAPILEHVHKNIPEIYMDCHMMVSDPARWVPEIKRAGGSSYTFHYEACSSPSDVMHVLELIQTHRMKSGLAISPNTPASSITDEMGNKADLLLVMTVHPGRGGQKFMPECLKKVEELRSRFPGKNIQVDGGVGATNACQCAQAGSNVLVAGTAIFGSSDPKQTITDMRSQVNGAFEDAAKGEKKDQQ